MRTSSFTVMLVLATVIGCSKPASETPAKTNNTTTEKPSAYVNSNLQSDLNKTTATVRFKVYEHEADLEFKIDDVTYPSDKLSAPQELAFGRHVVSVRRKDSSRFEVPFVVEASKDELVVDVASPTRAAAMAIINAGGSVIFFDKPATKDIHDLPDGEFSFDGAGFYAKQFDDSVLESLNQIKLRRLDVSFSNMSDNGLRVIRDFSDLEQLGLNKTNVTAEGLRLIANASPPLKHVLVEGLELPDEFLDHLRNCQLSIFTAKNTNFGDQYVDALQGRNFWFCRLDGTKVTDAGMKLLQGTKFKELGLANTSISDAGIKHCLQFEKLEAINLKDTQVTEAGIEMLKQKFPDVKVTF